MRKLRRYEGGRGGALESLRFVRRSWPSSVGLGPSQRQGSDHVVFSHGARGNLPFLVGSIIEHPGRPGGKDVSPGNRCVEGARYPYTTARGSSK